jgi:hypothetical protein
MNPVQRLFLALIFSCGGAGAVSAITTTNSSSVLADLVSVAGNGGSAFHGTSIPASQLIDLTRGGYYSRTQIDYTGSGDNVSLQSTFSQRRSGSLSDYSRGVSYVYFTVAANTTYDISGAYSALDVTSAGTVYLFSTLRDVTTATSLAYSQQISQTTANENFALGGSGGDSTNGNSGSLSGALIAGHLYEWHYNAFIYASPDVDGGASATGFMRLDIGGGAPSNTVPDTGQTLALLGLSVLALAACRRKVASV